MLLLTAFTLLAVFVILCWRGPFIGNGFGADGFRFHPAFPGCSLPFWQGPVGSNFIGISLLTSPRRSERNTEKMQTFVPTGTQIAKNGPISAKNNQSEIPLKTVADLMQILGSNPPKQFATIESAVATWALYVSNLPEHRITSPSYDPEHPEIQVPAKPLNEFPCDLLVDEQTRKGFRPFLKTQGRKEGGIRTYVDHIRFVGKRFKEIRYELDTLPSPAWQAVMKLAKANGCYDVALFFLGRMEPQQVTVKDTEKLLKKLVDDGKYYVASLAKIVRFWRVLRDLGLNSESPSFLEKRLRYGTRFAKLQIDFKSSLITLLAWLTADWIADRPTKKHLRPVTADGIRATVCMLFGFVLRKMPGLTIKTVPELLVKEVIEKYVAFAMNDLHVDGFYLRKRLEALCSAIRAHSKITKEQMAWFTELMGTLPNEVDQDKIKARKRLTRVEHRDLRKIPAKIRAARTLFRPGTPEYAMAIRNEAIFTWLVHLPWRQKNIRMMRLGVNLFCRPLEEDLTEIPLWVARTLKDNPKAEFWQIRFTKAETKMKHGVVAVLPKSIVGILEEYLSVRHLLVEASKNKKAPDTVFLSERAKTMTMASMTDLIQTLTFRHLDPAKAINPHRFRDLFAYAYLKDNPKDFLTLSKILWHKSVQVTIDTYGAEFDIASGVCAAEAWAAAWDQ
jgi:integrase